jgi:hypothetical protein
MMRPGGKRGQEERSYTKAAWKRRGETKGVRDNRTVDGRWPHGIADPLAGCSGKSDRTPQVRGREGSGEAGKRTGREVDGRVDGPWRSAAGSGDGRAVWKACCTSGGEGVTREGRVSVEMFRARREPRERLTGAFSVARAGVRRRVDGRGPGNAGIGEQSWIWWLHPVLFPAFFYSICSLIDRGPPFAGRNFGKKG